MVGDDLKWPQMTTQIFLSILKNISLCSKILNILCLYKNQWNVSDRKMVLWIWPKRHRSTKPSCVCLNITVQIAVLNWSMRKITGSNCLLLLKLFYASDGYIKWNFDTNKWINMNLSQKWINLDPVFLSKCTKLDQMRPNGTKGHQMGPN